MNGNRVLLDTNVIIFASQQKIDYVELLRDYSEIYVSIITYMEVYGFDGIKKNEKQLIDTIFDNLIIIDIDLSIAANVVEFRKQKIKKIKLPDAIILATAKHLNADLLTDDWDDFEGIEDTVNIIKIR